MKKTYNINLGGIVFHIDEDAYDLLDKYLSNLRIHFSKEEGAEEIVHDMELRISELFSERLNEKKQVITLTDVEEIIAQMGKPEEFSEDTTQDTNVKSLVLSLQIITLLLMTIHLVYSVSKKGFQGVAL